MTGDDFRRTLIWWFVLGVVAGVFAMVYVSNKSYGGTATEKLLTNYNYVIIGAGTAGCVLANRLSEDPAVKVLLIEAGGDDAREPRLHVPLLSTLMKFPEYDWMQYTVPQENAAKAMNEQRVKLTRGRALGGSSLFNNMIYSRGARQEYDNWARLGNTGWSFRDVIPFFHKAEGALSEDLKSSAYHSSTGPLPVSGSRFPYPDLQDVFRDASQQLGFNPLDCNGKDSIGFCQVHSTIRNGVRASASRVYLRPVLDRKNLHVATFSHVTKILISNGKAIGVEFLRNGRKDVIGVENEVVLSAGATGSPQILMLSGIGPREVIEDLKIYFHSDLPVGKNLFDSVVVPVKVFINESYTLTPPRVTSVISNLKYKLRGTGPLATPVGIFGTILTNTASTNKDTPNIMLYGMATFPELWDAMNWNIKPDVIKDLETQKSGKQQQEEGFTFLVQLIKPTSRGTLVLKSSNPFEQPSIDPNYLQNDDDTSNLINGIKQAFKFLKSKAFRRFQPRLPKKGLSVCAKHKLYSDDYLECFVRHVTVSGDTIGGACRMGNDDDNSTVVDPFLRVKGIDKLRVVDSSVFPTPISGSNYAPVVMVAEKAAEMIKQANKRRTKKPLTLKKTQKKLKQK